MNKRFFLLLFFVVGFLKADEWITSFESDITIHKDSSMTVKETIAYEFDGRSIIKPKRGIFRDFPTKYRDQFNTWYNVGFAVINVTKDGKPIPYTTSYLSNGVRLKIGDPGVIIQPGTHVYEITYKTNRQLGFFNDYDELYWNVTGQAWRFPIKQVAARVTLPSEVPKDKIQVEGYMGYQGKKNRNYIAHIENDGTAVFKTTRPLKAGQGFTLVEIWPKGYINEPTLIDKIIYFFQDNLLILWLFFGLLLLLVFYLFAWIKIKKQNPPGTIIPLFDPPNDLSPGAMRYIYRMKYDNKVFASEIVNAAVEGIVIIKYQSSFWGGTYTLEKQKEPSKPFIQQLFQQGSSITINPKNQRIVSAAVKTLKNGLRTVFAHYFRFYAGYFLGGLFISLGLLVPAFAWGPASGQVGWFFVFLIIFIFINVCMYSNLFQRYSKAGQIIKDEIDGFKMFLETTETERLKIIGTPPTKTPKLYEKYLPYAIALGVEQQWSQQFAPLFIELEKKGTPYMPLWCIGRPFNTHAIGNFASNLSNTLNSTIASASIPPGKSSGFGRSGGAGGGGGGGGGGSW